MTQNTNDTHTHTHTVKKPADIIVYLGGYAFRSAAGKFVGARIFLSPYAFPDIELIRCHDS